MLEYKPRVERKMSAQLLCDGSPVEPSQCATWELISAIGHVGDLLAELQIELTRRNDRHLHDCGMEE